MRPSQRTPRHFPRAAPASCQKLGRTAEAGETWQAALPILDRLNDPEAARLRDWFATIKGGG